MEQTFEHWTLEVTEHVAHVTLNRPEQNNRIDNTTLTELGALSKIISEDSDIWIVVLQANGDNFSAGVDVSLIGDLMNQDPNTYRTNLKIAQGFLDQFEAIEKPIIASLKGHVIGGGMILALCCDFRIAADTVKFSLPEVKRSIGVIMGTQRITRTIGAAHTKELVMLGNPIHADRAADIGLVNRVVPRHLLEETVDELVEQMASLPPLAVGLCKKIINEGQFLPRAGQDLEIEAQAALLKTADFKEAIDSFFEKRKPVYKGA